MGSSASNFKDFSRFEFDDFVEEHEFRDWVIAPSKEKDEFWRKFLEAHPEKEEEIERAREFLLETKGYFESSDISESEIHSRLGQVLERTSAAMSYPSKAKHPGSYKYRRLAVAASLALLLSAFGWYLYGPQYDFRTYRTDFAEWRTVNLPDGSEVKLNANSELILAENWSEGVTRQVWLKGEAFFSVTKKLSTNTKFQVITDDLTVEVLGTEFNVRDRGDHTEIFLKEGQVALDMGESQETLSPGDFISFSAEKNEIIQRQKLSGDRYSSWKQGVLLLNDATVLQILKEIEEIYGVEIKVSNKAMLLEKRTIGVPMENLDIVIPILEKTLEVSITKERNKLFVR